MILKTTLQGSDFLMGKIALQNRDRTNVTNQLLDHVNVLCPTRPTTSCVLPMENRNYFSLFNRI